MYVQMFGKDYKPAAYIEAAYQEALAQLVPHRAPYHYARRLQLRPHRADQPRSVHGNYRTAFQTARRRIGQRQQPDGVHVAHDY